MIRTTIPLGLVVAAGLGLAACGSQGTPAAKTTAAVPTTAASTTSTTASRPRHHAAKRATGHDRVHQGSRPAARHAKTLKTGDPGYKEPDPGKQVEQKTRPPGDGSRPLPKGVSSEIAFWVQPDSFVPLEFKAYAGKVIVYLRAAGITKATTVDIAGKKTTIEPDQVKKLAIVLKHGRYKVTDSNGSKATLLIS